MRSPDDVDFDDAVLATSATGLMGRLPANDSLASDSLGRATFDALAETYDNTFTKTLLGRLLRAAVHVEIRPVMPAGSHVLDLGCGTGEDAILLAARGVRVHGVDASRAMVTLARTKAGAQAHLPSAPTFEVADIAHDSLPAGPFDAAFANFGVMNCIRERRRFAHRLAGVLRPGSRVVFVVMGRWCPWEWIWYSIRGDLSMAFRRLRGKASYRGAEIIYPLPRTLARELAPHFVHVRTAGIGFLLPPTYASHWIERHPGLAGHLAAVERRLRHGHVFAALSDHFLIEFSRT